MLELEPLIWVNVGILVNLLVELDNIWVILLSVPYLSLQLCPEDDGDQGEHHGGQQSQVRVEQHSEDECNKPDHL